MIRIEHIFLIWSLTAVALAYGGAIASAYSSKKRWIAVTIAGQIFGMAGLLTILAYLGI